MISNQLELRKKILDMSFVKNLGHIPSAFSMVDYFYELDKFIDYNRDKLIIGKPYGSQAYYTVWNEEFQTYGVTHKHPKVYYSDETLCNALGIACGVCLSYKDGNVIVNTGDAALQNGVTLEALQFAGHHSLSNLILCVDFNGKQIFGDVSKILNLDNIGHIIRTFGWDVFEIDGHNVDSQLVYTILNSKRKRPSAFLFRTVKGYGIDELQDRSWHYRIMTEKEYRDFSERLKCESI